MWRLRTWRGMQERGWVKSLWVKRHFKATVQSSSLTLWIICLSYHITTIISGFTLICRVQSFGLFCRHTKYKHACSCLYFLVFLTSPIFVSSPCSFVLLLSLSVCFSSCTSCEMSQKRVSQWIILPPRRVSPSLCLLCCERKTQLCSYSRD